MRRNRRRAARSSGALRRVLRAAAIMSVLAGAGLAAAQGLHWAKAHPYFAVREIDVVARGPLDAKTILGWSGLATGMSTWEVGERQAEERLLAHPRIRSAFVARTLPGRVQVHVEEREPVAVLFGDPLQMVAADGVVFPPCEGEMLAGLPYVSGFSARSSTSGVASARLRDVAQLVASWRARSQWPAISEVRPEADDLMVFVSGAPLAVRFPAAAGPDDFARLGTVLELWKGRERALVAVDLSMSAGEAVLRIRGAKPGGTIRRAVRAPVASRPAPHGIVSAADRRAHGARGKTERGSST